MGVSFISPWIWAVLLLGASASHLAAESSQLDPEFSKVPFSEWLAGGSQTPLRWSERALPVVLSVHQRLLARLQVQLDGAEAAKRRGEGSLVFYFQLTDSKGHVFQDHTTYDLEKVEAGLKSQDLICTESAFVLPGDYVIALAIYDTATKEHSVKKDKLHILPLKGDPLPDLWRDLPTVEFLEASEQPDRWFAPKLHGKLNLPVTARRPVQVDVMMNLTPSQVSSRGYGIQDRNFSFLFPALKAIAQMRGSDIALNVSLLDLARQRVTFHQDDAGDLDWQGIKSSLSDANSGSIDVKSLADRQHNASFFVSELRRTIESGKPGLVHAIIILSGPMVFDTDQDLRGMPYRPPADCRVFYVRYQNPPAQVAAAGPGMRGRRGLGGYPGPGRSRFPVEEVAS